MTEKKKRIPRTGLAGALAVLDRKITATAGEMIQAVQEPLDATDQILNQEADAERRRHAAQMDHIRARRDLAKIATTLTDTERAFLVGHLSRNGAADA